MDVASSSGEDDIGISALRRRRKTNCIPQHTKVIRFCPKRFIFMASDTQEETDSEEERPSKTSVPKSVVRGRKFVFKESDTSDSDVRTFNVTQCVL